MSLLEKLKAGKRNIMTMDYPGTGTEVALQVLSCQDVQDAVFAAEKYFKKLEIEITATTLDVYEDERTTQILFRALRDPGDPKKSFAATVDELRRHLEKEEKSILAEAYNRFEQECSPNYAKLTDDEFETLWEDIKKNPAILSKNSNSPMLRSLLLYLASLPATSPKDNGSTS